MIAFFSTGSFASTLLTYTLLLDTRNLSVLFDIEHALIESSVRKGHDLYNSS